MPFFEPFTRALQFNQDLDFFDKKCISMYFLFTNAINNTVIKVITPTLTMFLLYTRYCAKCLTCIAFNPHKIIA